MNLKLEEDAILLNTAAAASAGTAVTGAVVDTQNVDSVLFFCTIATFNAGNFLKLQGGAASDGSDAADIAGSKVVAVANGQTVGIEIAKSLQRYVRPVVIRTGANTATGDLYQIKHNASVQPVSNQVTNSLITSQLRSPALGTP